jgi:hypothetical protein
LNGDPVEAKSFVLQTLEAEIKLDIKQEKTDSIKKVAF